MFEVGKICVKMAGRDAGQKCVIVDVLEGKYVMIDGMTRRRKCNTLHLEPTGESLEIAKNASHEDVVKAFKNLDHHIKDKKAKPKTEKPKKTLKSSKKKQDSEKETTRKEKNIKKK